MVMKSDNKKPKVNPLVAKLLDTAKDETVVQLEGYVGPSETSILRLYRSLDLSEYMDVPEVGILHFEELSEGGDGRVRVWVRGSAKIQFVSVNSAVMEAAQLKAASSVLGSLIGRFGFIPPIPPLPPPPIGPCLLECQRVYDHCIETNPTLEHDPKVCEREWAACLLRCVRRLAGSVA
jgi:hypothetical protein